MGMFLDSSPACSLSICLALVLSTLKVTWSPTARADSVASPFLSMSLVLVTAYVVVPVEVLIVTLELRHGGDGAAQVEGAAVAVSAVYLVGLRHAVGAVVPGVRVSRRGARGGGGRRPADGGGLGADRGGQYGAGDQAGSDVADLRQS